MKERRRCLYKKENFKPVLNPAISEAYTDDSKSKYSINPKDILISEKTFYEKLYPNFQIVYY